MYFPRMLDKIRMHTRGDLHEDYHPNLGNPTKGDGVLCNFLRVKFDELSKQVEKGGTDEEILGWCYEKGRRLNEGDILVWNGFISKLGWNDFATPMLEEQKQKFGAAHRTDIATFLDLMDLDEKRRS